MRFLAGFFLWVFASQAASFTLEQVLSSPFPSDLVTNGRGKIAWVQNAQGCRNVWFASAPDFQAIPLTRYREDDGQEISQLFLGLDGKFVAYTRGEGANGKGEYPNPRHAVSGVEQEVYVAPVSGGDPRKIGKGENPAISPDGNTLAYVSGGQVWSAPLAVASESAKEPTQLMHARGAIGSLDWSPDGKYLAITSTRDQHSFIAVYDVGGKTLRFLDPSVDFDQSPAWSPDSKQIAFLRVPTTQDAFAFGPKRSAQAPWSIRVADLASGNAREVWKAQPGPGSEFREVVSPHQLFWAAGDRLIFPWERSGWTHLYTFAVKGTDAKDLTPGEFEVESVALSPDAKSILYSSNQGDIDRRHIWLVDADGGSPRAITSGTGIEYSAVMPGPGATDAEAILHSDSRMPARAAIVRQGLPQDLKTGTWTADFPTSGLVEPQPVNFPGADGLQIHGQLFLPRDGKPKHPAVIFFHGGSRRQMLLGWHYMFYYHQAYGFNQYLASKGYVVLSVNYRSGIGYGLNFREALNYGATGASEYNDVIGAGLYMRSRADVIENRIGLWGGSYGGYLTALGLARASDIFTAGVDLHGVHEWNQEIQNFVPAYDPEKRQDLARVAFQSSPMAFVGTWKSPVLLIHGDDDRNVNFKQTLMLAEALRKQGVPFEQLIFPDEIHDFLTHDHWLEAYRAAEVFLGKYLLPQ